MANAGPIKRALSNQLADDLGREIVRGSLLPGDALTSEEVLLARFGVSHRLSVSAGQDGNGRAALEVGFAFLLNPAPTMMAALPVVVPGFCCHRASRMNSTRDWWAKLMLEGSAAAEGQRISRAASWREEPDTRSFRQRGKMAAAPGHDRSGDLGLEHG
jgi:DNA-binding transcriptional MocR family regulator